MLLVMNEGTVVEGMKIVLLKVVVGGEEKVKVVLGGVALLEVTGGIVLKSEEVVPCPDAIVIRENKNNIWCIGFLFVKQSVSQKVTWRVSSFFIRFSNFIMLIIIGSSDSFLFLSL